MVSFDHEIQMKSCDHVNQNENELSQQCNTEEIIKRSSANLHLKAFPANAHLNSCNFYSNTVRNRWAHLHEYW